LPPETEEKDDENKLHNNKASGNDNDFDGRTTSISTLARPAENFPLRSA
jgi:hypothetical protein